MRFPLNWRIPGILCKASFIIHFFSLYHLRRKSGPSPPYRLVLKGRLKESQMKKGGPDEPPWLLWMTVAYKVMTSTWAMSTRRNMVSGYTVEYATLDC